MRVLRTNDQGVSRGVINADLHAEPDLREVTFMDYQGTPHTVFVHKDGPFKSEADVLRGWATGELHDRPTETADAPDDEQGEKGQGY